MDMNAPEVEGTDVGLRDGFVEKVVDAVGCTRNAAIWALRASEKTLAARVSKPFIALTNEELTLIEDYILDIPVIGMYDEQNTPLDIFDSKCHDCN
jgi:hypothetical protein